MSDGAAAATGTDAGGQAPNTGQDAGQANGQTNGFDPGQIMQQFQGLQTSQEDLRTMIQGLGERIPQPEAEPEPGLELDLASFLGGEQYAPDESEDRTQRFNEQFNSQIQQMLQNGIQQAVDPLKAELKEFRQQQAMDDLVGEFPVLGANPEVAEQTIDWAQKSAFDIAEGEEWGQHLMQSPKFLRLVLGASIGFRALNDANALNSGEAGADAGARLENTGGAGPGNVFSGDDAAMKIVNAGNGPGSKVLDF